MAKVCNDCLRSVTPEGQEMEVLCVGILAPTVCQACGLTVQPTQQNTIRAVAFDRLFGPSTGG